MTNLLEAIELGKQVFNPEQNGAGLTILQQVSFQLAAGQSLAIVGASGSGKSTLLGLLAGLDLPSSGRVVLDGTDLAQLDEDGRAALRRRLAGFVFQSFQLLPNLTALENVLLPLELFGEPDALVRAQQVLHEVGLQQRQAHLPKQLSGGEQQRVALARAFVTRPRILFADEPTGNLDAATGKQIVDLMWQLNAAHGTTLILVTHDVQLAAACDRRLQLAAGRVVADD